MTTTNNEENGEISSQSQGQSLPWDDLLKLLSQPDPLADLIIDVEGHQLYTSKYMLANVSSKFRQMFTDAAAENPTILPLPGTSLRAAVDLLRWLLPSETLTISGRMGLYLDIRFLSFTPYCDVIIGTMASQLTSLIIAFSAVYSDADQRKHQSSASLAFVRKIHRWPMNSPHKWPLTRKMFPFDDVIMYDLATTISTGITSVILKKASDQWQIIHFNNLSEGNFLQNMSLLGNDTLSLFTLL